MLLVAEDVHFEMFHVFPDTPPPHFKIYEFANTSPLQVCEYTPFPFRFLLKISFSYIF